MKKSQLRQIIKEQINARKVHWKRCGTQDIPSTTPDTDAMTIGNNIPSPGEQFMSSNNIPAEITQVAPADPNATIINYDYHVCPAGTVTNIPTGTGDSNLNPIDTINIDKVPSIYDKPEKMGDRMNEIKKNKMKRIQLRETALVNLINRVINEQQPGWVYPPPNVGDPQRQCNLCITGQQLYSHLNNVSCSKPCSGYWDWEVEWFMCIVWDGTIWTPKPNCDYLANTNWDQTEWASFPVPCYKCDKFGKIRTIENYSQWGASQGPCPSGYQKDPDPLSSTPLEQRNPCDSSVDDNFVRTADDREQTDSPVLFQPSGDENIKGDVENIKGDVEEINESHLKRLIHRVINEQMTAWPECPKSCQQLIPNFKSRIGQKVSDKPNPCGFLRNRWQSILSQSNQFAQQFQGSNTQTPTVQDRCKADRFTCKLDVLSYQMQQQGGCTPPPR